MSAKHSELGEIKFNDQGLVPAIIQSSDSKRVLMMAWMNQESLDLTLKTGQTVFWSRSRNEIWHKGATSGNTQEVHLVELDCDGDSLLIQVSESGPACHTGLESCFDVAHIALADGS